MKLTNYSPTFRQVLFKEVVPTKTDSGILLPTKDMVVRSYSSMFENEQVLYDGSKTKLGKYIVVKTGSDCQVVKTGDELVLMRGINPEEILLDNEQYFQVMEQQIIGVHRNDSV